MCVLAATRAQLECSGAHGQLPRLALRRGLIGAECASDGQQDASEFLGFLLETLRTDELRAGRHGVWGNLHIDVNLATHAERLFAFVRETRKRCKTCLMVRVWYESAYMWLVKASCIAGGAQTLAEAYIQSCEPAVETLPCPSCVALHY